MGGRRTAMCTQLAQEEKGILRGRALFNILNTCSALTTPDYTASAPPEQDPVHNLEQIFYTLYASVPGVSGPSPRHFLPWDC